MKSARWFRVGIIAIFISAATLAILAPLIQAAGPFRFLATLGGIILGPGALVYRLTTVRPWAECLTVGIAINVAAVMLLGLSLVSLRFWHPIPFYQLISVTTLLLSGILLRKELLSTSTSHK